MDASTTSALPSQMRAIVFRKALSAPKGMEIKLQPRPDPKDNEVLIKVKCFGLNFADTLARKGQYGDAPPFPFIPGYECSGVVVACGNRVTKFGVGDKVLALTKFGSYAEYAVAEEVGVCSLPSGMTFKEGASIPVVFGTAYYAIHETGPVRKGDKVLIHAAAGGVGLAAVQLAKLAGLTVFGTASNPEKIKLLTDEFHVDHVINYRSEDFVAAIKKINGDQPSLDIVLDAVGGTYFKKELPLVRATGRVVGYGASSVSDMSILNAFSIASNVTSMLTLSSIELMMGSKAFVGVNMFRVSQQRQEILAEILGKIKDLFEAGKLRTFVHKTYKWTQIDDAHKDLESRGTTGKVVLEIEDE